MTSSIHNQRRLRNRGFTLIEMLIVIGVIVLLMSILLPVVNWAYTHAVRTKMQAEIQTISAALAAYKQDHRDYPQLDYSDTNLFGPSGAKYPGSVLLCWALIGPGAVTQDGYDGPGFTVMPAMKDAGGNYISRGQVYGPYVQPAHFKMVPDPNMPPPVSNPAINTEAPYYLADKYGHPILYFKANINGNIYSGDGYCANWLPPPFGTSTNRAPYYNYRDNMSAFDWPSDSGGSPPPGLIRMRLMLGDRYQGGSAPNGAIETAGATTPENPVLEPFLLWSAGPDEQFGIDITRGPDSQSMVLNCDDATNFSK